MTDMHAFETPGCNHTVPARGKRPNIIEMSIAWSRTTAWKGPFTAAPPPRGNPRAVSARSLPTHTQEHGMSSSNRLRLLRKITAHRQKSSQSADRESPPLSSLAIFPPQHSASNAALLGKRVLTPRELEVLRLVARGETDRHIAERLYLSRRTVSCHVSNILDKLNVESRRKAVLTAMRIGLL